MYENNCSETIKTAFSKSNDNKKCAYYVFETVEASYYNKLGKLVNYNRYAQVDKKATINELIELLQECATRYHYNINITFHVTMSFGQNLNHPVSIQFYTSITVKTYNSPPL